MYLSRTRLTLACAAVGCGSLVFVPTPGCSSQSNPASAQDAAPDSSTSDDGGQPASCAGDPAVMQWMDRSGQLQDPDWSCYQPDAAVAAPIVFDDAAADVVDAPDDGDGAPPPDDAAAEAAPVEAGVPDAGVPEAGVPEAGVDAGAKIQDTFQLTDFIAHTPVSGAVVDIFFRNTLAGNVMPDFTATTRSDDAAPPGYGGFLMPHPTGPVFAYRVRERSSAPALTTVVQFDNLTPVRGSTFAGNSISTAIYQTLLAGVLGTSHSVPGSTTFVSAARDCANHDLLGGILRLVDDATSQPIATGTGPTDVQEQYFGPDGLPHADCTHTLASPIALWTAINVPTSRALRVQLWGRMHASDAQPVLIGERKLELYPDIIVIARPYRLTPNP